MFDSAVPHNIMTSQNKTFFTTLKPFKITIHTVLECSYCNPPSINMLLLQSLSVLVCIL